MAKLCHYQGMEKLSVYAIAFVLEMNLAVGFLLMFELTGSFP